MQSGCTLTDVPKAIQIREVPDDVHRVLRTRAAAAGVSLSEYLRGEIERIASRPSIVEVLRRAGEREYGVSREAILRAIDEGRKGR
jgi:plasmid stability protein